MSNQPEPARMGAVRTSGSLASPTKFGNIEGGHEAVLKHHGWKKVHQHEDMSVWHHPKHGGYVVHEALGHGISHHHAGEMNSGGAEDHLDKNYRHDTTISDHHHLDSHLHRYHAAMNKSEND